MRYTTMITSKPKFCELAIALLPTPEIEQEAIRLNKQLEHALIDCPNKINLIHISLFQGRFRESQFEKIVESLKQIAELTSSFRIELDSKLTEACGNLFWNAKLQSQLFDLHKQVVAAISPYRDGILPVFVDCYPKLSKDKQQFIDDYGTPHVFRNFFPHITVYYNIDPSKFNCAKTIKPQKHFSFFTNKLIVGRIGYDGNLEEINGEFDLKV